jgi:dTDP-4-dehydrorhamnose 3,5-epimerase
VELNERARDAFAVQDYRSAARIDGVEVVKLRRFNDDGGSMTELGRFLAGQHADLAGFEAKQLNYSELDPGAIKAFHLHRRQTDVWFVPPSDKILTVMHDCRAKSPTAGTTMRVVLGDGNSQLVRIPPGVAHGCRNLAAAVGRIIYLVDVQFSTGDDCDEGRLPWDFLGAAVWDVARG